MPWKCLLRGTVIRIVLLYYYLCALRYVYLLCVYMYLYRNAVDGGKILGSRLSSEDLIALRGFCVGLYQQVYILSACIY